MRWEVYSVEDFADFRVYPTRADAIAAMERRTLRYRRCYGPDYSSLYFGTHDIRPHWQGAVRRWAFPVLVALLFFALMLLRW